MSSKKAIALLGLILLLALGFMLSGKESGWFLNRGRFGEKASSAEVFENDESTRSSRRTQTAPRTRAEPTHRYGELKDFIIPELKLENATFGQALNQLRNSYYKTCLKTGETPIPFKFTVEEPSQRTIDITLTNLSFTNMLGTLATIEGMHLGIEQEKITFTRMKKTGTSYTQALKVPAGLLEKLKRNATGPPGLYSVEPNDHNDAGLLQKAVAQRFNELMALDSVAISYAASTNQLIVKADARDLERIKHLIDHYLAVPPSQIRTMSHIVVLDDGVPFEPAEASQPNYLQKISTTPGIEISTAPSVLSRNGEASLIEVRRSINQRDWVGYKISSQTMLEGFGYTNQSNYEQGALPINRDSGVVYTKTPHQSFVPRGNTRVITLPRNSGKRSYMIVTHQEIDATGRSVERNR